MPSTPVAMSPTRASLKGFLATARKALLSPPAQRPKPLTFVVGNESADLDSLCSAVVFAYFRTHTPAHGLHIPLSNLPRADLALRPELQAVLHPAGLKPDDLITLCDLPREGLHPQDTRWLLVDHNALTGRLAASFSGQVVGCIDHHVDEGVIPHDVPEGQPRRFATCGSCMSLVLDHCKPTWDSLAASACEDGTSAAECDAQLAHVALAPILIDTINLTSKDKTTDWDVHATELAESKLASFESQSQSRSQVQTQPSAQEDAAPYNRETYHATLTTLKEQIAGLPYRDVLRKDYKRWTEGSLGLGMSTVVQDLTTTTATAGEGERGAFVAALRAWAGEQGLDIAAVMTVSRPGGVFTRELLVWGLSEAGVAAVGEFRRRFAEKLGLESWEGGGLDGGGEGEGEWRVCWRQKEVSCSRKQVGPMLREAMRESAKL
ncbi:uncharacterized protein B0H64DRAFT_463386 [Chaetomium fimeti]|uniref:DHHA2 domain-containing protein n=1 Tax=Chaetomium fimeti TaxID=1854472 RepID=A0AAE0LRQ9_9PEZI|nr:hypothetical protein B0H64DRAFT_463386 [Chaetomium fimeti]